MTTPQQTPRGRRASQTPPLDEIAALRDLIGTLTARIESIEQRMGMRPDPRPITERLFGPGGWREQS